MVENVFSWQALLFKWRIRDVFQITSSELVVASVYTVENESGIAFWRIGLVIARSGELVLGLC